MYDDVSKDGASGATAERSAPYRRVVDRQSKERVRRARGGLAMKMQRRRIPIRVPSSAPPPVRHGSPATELPADASSLQEAASDEPWCLTGEAEAGDGLTAWRDDDDDATAALLTRATTAYNYLPTQPPSPSTSTSTSSSLFALTGRRAPLRPHTSPHAPTAQRPLRTATRPTRLRQQRMEEEEEEGEGRVKKWGSGPRSTTQWSERTHRHGARSRWR